MWLLASLRPRQVLKGKDIVGTFSIVLVVYNEEKAVQKRLNELTGLIAGLSQNSEIIVVSDGSTDKTVTIARRYTDKRVQVIELEKNSGKSEALSKGCALARGDIIVLADVRQNWAPDALSEMLCNFNDPDVGAVSGNLVIESSPGILAGVSLYWKYEKWIRSSESRYYSTVGASGSISALRKKYFRPIPKGTLVDDLYWPLQVVMQGARVVFEEKAIAYDRLPARPGDEFRRKIRTLSGNFQLLMLLPSALSPWHNPIWYEYISHKILRLIVPWALMVLLVTSAVLPQVLYKVMFVLQCVFYLLGIAGIFHVQYLRTRLSSAAGSFLLLNSAAWLAFWYWISGRAGASWRKSRYEEHSRP